MSTFQITIKNRHAELKEVQDHFHLFAQHHNVANKTRQKIGIIMDELLNNIINHAFQGDDELHDIEVKVELEEGYEELFVTISSEGIPFNPLEGEETDIILPVDESSIGELGIMLARKLSHKLGYKRDLDRNVVTFIMSLND